MPFDYKDNDDGYQSWRSSYLKKKKKAHQIII